MTQRGRESVTEMKPLPELPADWRLVAAVGLWSLTGLMALVLAGRASVGAFDASVGALMPCLATGFATIGSLGAWGLFGRAQDRCPSNRSRFGRRLAIGLASLTAPALVAWATTVSASPLAPGLVTGILVLGLTVVVVGEGVRIVPLAEPASGTVAAAAASAAASDPSLSPRVGHSIVEPVVRGNGTDNPPDLESEESEVVQQCSRRREPDGTERIEAVLFATFAPGERETALHLPIHPVLRTIPQVECEPLDGAEVTTTVTAAHPYGVRVEVRRSSPFVDALSVPVGIEIVATGPAANVA